MRQFFKKYIILILGICFIWLVGIPLLFSRVIPVICENITYNTQYNIFIEKPRLYMNIIPTSILKTDRVSISNKNTNNNIEIKDFEFKIRLLPLLSGRIHFDAIQASEVNINYVIAQDNYLNKDFLSQVLKTKVICDSLNINKFLIKIKKPDVVYSAIHEGQNLFYKKNGRYLKINIESAINIDGKISDVNASIYLPKNSNTKNSNIDINLSNFDIEPLSNYFKNYLPDGTKFFKGVIDLNVSKEHFFICLKNGAYINQDEAKSLIFPDKLVINSRFNLAGKDFIIDNAEITSKNINTIVSGIVSNYLGNVKPEINLNVQINPSKIEDFISILPPFNTEDINAYKLKKYKFYGDIIGNLSLKGSIYEPSIFGSIFISNGVLTKPIPNAKGATIKLDFKGKYLDYDVIVPASATEKVMVKGGVELYNIKYADMRVWSTKNVDLSIAEDKVVPIHEILNFVIGPVPIMDITGQGNIDITVKGNRKTPHVWGVLNFYNVVTHFKDIPDLVLSNAETILKFDDENAFFNLKHGVVDGKNININGNCNVSGKFDFDVKSDNQELAYLYNSIKTSSVLLDDVKKILPQLDEVHGLTNFKLKVFGNIKDIADIKFNENFFVKGNVELLGNSVASQGVRIHNTKGNINFENTNASFNIQSSIGASPLIAKGSIKDNYADADISIPKLNLRDIIDSTDKFQQEISNIIVDVVIRYKGKTNKIEYDKIDFSAKILDVTKNNKLKISNGLVTLKKDRLQINDINGNFINTPSSFKINLQVDDISTKPLINGKILLKDFELQLINTFSEYLLIPKDIRDLMQTVHFDKGKINVNANISNNSVNASTDIGGIAFTYTPLKLPIRVVNGSIYVKKNYLGLNKINMMAGDLPILLDGGIHRIFTQQDFDIYLNTKPKQEFIDKYYNNNKLYPLKIKGDIVCKANLKGVKDDLNIALEANMEKDSSVYYKGAIINDVENSIILNLNMNVIKQNILKIKEFSYDKLISSQGKRTTRLNMLKLNGGIDLLKSDIVFHDLKIKTSNPTDARIFNLMFGKPNIKQGQFMSDLKINGMLSKPNILGTFNIVEANIPFLDTTLKKIAILFKDNTIELSTFGEILGNDIIFKGTLKNKLIAPYYVINADLYTKILDLNYITNRLKSVQIEEENTFTSLDILDLENLIIKNMKLRADEIRLRNLTASKVSANVSINEKQDFKLNDFQFDIAKGNLEGDFSYNLSNSLMSLNIKANKINANDITIALFNLKNQIYGDLTGSTKLSCNGTDYGSCMKTLDGKMTFNVDNGRMPKLGSLEYLLKAGNLLRGGITGLSVNGVIDILTPLKTGEFSNIYGEINIQNGIADDVEIATKGKDLSLFISGKYNMATSDADMEVLGLLSKKISTLLGPVGNISLNTLFNVVPGIDLSKDSKILDKINKIPGIELNEKTFRKFIAEIKGDINGDNYVKSFKWIN